MKANIITPQDLKKPPTQNNPIGTASKPDPADQVVKVLNTLNTSFNLLKQMFKEAVEVKEGYQKVTEEKNKQQTITQPQKVTENSLQGITTAPKTIPINYDGVARSLLARIEAEFERIPAEEPKLELSLALAFKLWKAQTDEEKQKVISMLSESLKEDIEK